MTYFINMPMARRRRRHEEGSFYLFKFLFLIPFAVNAEVKEVKGMLKDIH